MTTTIAKPTGAVVLPKAVRDRAGIKAGTPLHVVEVEGGVYLKPVLPPSEDELAEVRKAAGGPSALEPRGAAAKLNALIHRTRRGK